ncbi:hypothetical protein MHB50_04765 [Siminovitchia sp. FSL H7-0308]|uniref:Uncharacterized protein n=1 Tax=Siminovitchia thermophila TaxID=1245522 RepID=A0ABS2R554_9BACI|nr:hypothetical protein [Siminovitchia thermophila]MBM7714790.1 hypothetical protein [Siminovitchia thermophila]
MTEIVQKPKKRLLDTSNSELDLGRLVTVLANSPLTGTSLPVHGHFKRAVPQSVKSDLAKQPLFFLSDKTSTTALLNVEE